MIAPWFPATWWIAAGARAAAPIECDAPVEKPVVDRLLEQASVAIAELDGDVLADAVSRARLLVRCVAVVLPREEIAEVYRVSGISKYVSGDLVGAVADFKVARALAPDATIDEALGKPLRMTYDAVPPPTGLLIVLPPVAEGALMVDGARTDQAPADRAYCLQWLDDDGLVRGTWLVDEGSVPPYPVKGTSGKPKKDKGKDKDKGKAKGDDDGGGGDSGDAEKAEPEPAPAPAP